MKPATKLPWHANETSLRESSGDWVADFKTRLDDDERSKEDAAYAAHACNLYPELVETLEAIGLSLPNRYSKMREQVTALLAKCEP